MTNPFVASPKRPAPPAKAVLNYLIVVVVVVALFWVSLGMAGIAISYGSTASASGTASC